MGAISDGRTPYTTTEVELTTLYAVSKLLAGSLDLKQTLHDVLNVLSSYMAMRRCTVSLREEPSGDLVVAAAAGLSREEIARGRFKPGEGILGEILRNEVPMVVPDVTAEPRFLARTGSHVKFDGEVVSFIGVPIKSRGAAVGVLAADRALPDRAWADFDTDVRLLTMVAGLIGQTVALHQAVAQERDFMMGEIHRREKQRDETAAPAAALENMVGAGPRMREVFAEARIVARSPSTVLLRGESGTGKELIARAVHSLSARADGPFVKLNCAALSETLLESELFGHEKGAFTGAVQGRKGRFELADGGTLFLDEIGDISPAFQAKLLRVLQEREFERVGGTRTLKVDVRLICATNRNLEAAVAEGRFRADLYYRINVVSILLPALRERPEDIPLLIEHFAQKFAPPGRAIRFSPRALAVMSGCCWPGNVRELQNCVEREIATAVGDVIEYEHLACNRNKCFSSVLWQYQQRQSPVPVLDGPAPERLPSPDAMPAAAPLEDAAPDDSRQRLIWAMEKSGWVQAKAARLLGLTPRQIGYALRRHGVSLKRL